MEEVVRAFNWVIQKGWAFYWATSEYVMYMESVQVLTLTHRWSAREIEEAHRQSNSEVAHYNYESSSQM
jgi:hypothetical protein